MIYTLVAGINGAGKSTIYNEMTDLEKNMLGYRINPDELNLKYGYIKGGKEAIRLRKYYLQNRFDFHQETTLTGKTILNSIDEAFALGFNVNLLYMSLESAKIAINRVANRVSNGGHEYLLIQ